MTCKLSQEDINQLLTEQPIDSYWEKIENELNEEYINSKDDLVKLLDYFIHVTQRTIEYRQYTHNPKIYARDPERDFIVDALLSIEDLHEDILYINAMIFLFMNSEQIDKNPVVFYSLVLERFISLKEGGYNPIDEFNKKRIRKLLWDFYATTPWKQDFFRYFKKV